MTTQTWRDYDGADSDLDWRPVRAEGRVIAGLVNLGRSTMVYTYDSRLTSLDGSRFSSVAAARAAIDAALAAPLPRNFSLPARRRPTRPHQPVTAEHGRFYDG